MQAEVTKPEFITFLGYWNVVIRGFNISLYINPKQCNFCHALDFMTTRDHSDYASLPESIREAVVRKLYEAHIAAASSTDEYPLRHIVITHPDQSSSRVRVVDDDIIMGGAWRAERKFLADQTLQEQLKK